MKEPKESKETWRPYSFDRLREELKRETPRQIKARIYAECQAPKEKYTTPTKA